MWDTLRFLSAGALVLGLGVALGLDLSGLPRSGIAAVPEDPAVSRAAEIEPASREQSELVRRSLANGLDVSDAYALRSRHPEHGYVVSARVFGPGLERGPVAVWLVGGDTVRPDVLVPINHIAQRFSIPGETGGEEELDELYPEMFALEAYVERQSETGHPENGRAAEMNVRGSDFPGARTAATGRRRS